MKLTLLGMASVIYPSTDLQGDKTWWTQVLGIEPYFDQPIYVGFNVAGYELALLPDADPADGALTYWGVDDVEAAVTAMVEAGSTVHNPVADVGEDIITATVRTPSDVVMGLIYNPHFKLG
jgi:predicted enzyme related to lactoylglutathione lyase